MRPAPGAVSAGGRGSACRPRSGPTANGARRPRRRAGRSRRSPAGSIASAIIAIRSLTAAANSAGRCTTCTSQKPTTAVLRAINMPGSTGVGWLREAIPNVGQPAERRQRGQALVEHRAAGHLEHDVDAACRRWPRAARRSGRRRSSRRRRRRRDRAPVDACPRSMPSRSPDRRPTAWPAGSAIVPTPPAPACTTTDSPSCRCVLVRSRCQAVAPWTSVVSAAASDTASGTGNSRRGSAATFSA